MNETYEMIKLADIVLSPNNPRTVNLKSLSFIDLTESIRGLGVIEPVHVRRCPGKGVNVELLAGERRYRASLEAGRKDIRAINHGDITDAEAFEITFAENFGHEDLTTIEQGRAVGILLEKY